MCAPDGLVGLVQEISEIERAIGKKSVEKITFYHTFKELPPLLKLLLTGTIIVETMQLGGLSLSRSFEYLFRIMQSLNALAEDKVI